MSKTTNEFAPEVRERAVRMVLGREGKHPFRWRRPSFSEFLHRSRVGLQAAGDDCVGLISFNFRSK